MLAATLRNLYLWAFLALVLVCTLPYALASDLTLTWVAPTQYSDNSNIAAGTAITYNVYGGKQGAALTQLATGLTTLTNVQKAVAVGINCYAVSAVVNGQESAQAGPVCSQVFAPAKPPSGLKVSVAVVANTVYTLIKAPDRMVFVPVGTVPPDTPCIAEEQANGYNLVPRASVTFTGSVQPPAVFAKCS